MMRDLPMQEKLLRMSAEAQADRKVHTTHCNALAFPDMSAKQSA